MTPIEILTAIVLTLISALVVFVIVYIGRITRSIQHMQVDISNLADRLEPLLTSLNDLTLKLNELGDEAKNQLDVTKGLVFSVRNRVEDILAFEEKIRTGIDGPISGILNQIKAVSNGVNTFLSYLKK